MKSLKKQHWVVIILLLIQTGLIAYSTTRHSPNLNEPAHLVAGISHWKYGRFELYRVNPPLIRLLAVLPVLFTETKYDWTEFYERPGARPVFILGKQFVTINGEQSIWLFTLARWAILPLSLLGGIYCYKWAQELYGVSSGLLAITFWVFSPNILAHAQFITPDCGATSLGLISAYYFRKWLQSLTWKSALLAGLTLGLAELTKTTWIVLFGLYPAIWFLSCFNSTIKKPKTAQLSQLMTILVLGVYLLNLGYAFEGSFTPLKKFEFVSQSFTGADKSDSDSRSSANRFAESWLGNIPVPLPKNYLLGIDIQKQDFEDFGSESYLQGKFQTKGWWYYYLYALVIKVPLGYWLIFVLATAGMLLKKIPTMSRIDFLVLISIPGSILILASSQTGFNHHMRYILPIFPFAFIWMSSVVSWRNETPKARSFSTVAVTLLTLWAILSSLTIYPHSLSYFNELVGGPRNGHKHLIHSNIDWGQDLLYLKNWINEHPEAKPMHLCYYSYVDPKALGLDYPLPPANKECDPDFTPPPGWYAISVNYLHGYKFMYDKDAFSYFQKYQPVSTAGYSIYIYRID
jgi:hypothetical protein